MQIDDYGYVSLSLPFPIEAANRLFETVEQSGRVAGLFLFDSDPRSYLAFEGSAEQPCSFGLIHEADGTFSFSVGDYLEEGLEGFDRLDIVGSIRKYRERDELPIATTLRIAAAYRALLASVPCA